MGIRRDIFFRQIGAKIAYYRILYGMEQNQLAEKVHISQSTLSRIERGKYGDNISLALLLDIAEGLEIDPSLLTTFSSMEKRMSRLCHAKTARSLMYQDSALIFSKII